jgi:hypothetical protein
MLAISANAIGSTNLAPAARSSRITFGLACSASRHTAPSSRVEEGGAEKMASLRSMILAGRMVEVLPDRFERHSQSFNLVRGASPDGEKRELRFHKVRGHYADYTNGKGLFGRLKVCIWIVEHTAGNPELGTVVSSYRVEK